jgi:hypothetical protein
VLTIPHDSSLCKVSLLLESCQFIFYIEHKMLHKSNLCVHHSNPFHLDNEIFKWSWFDEFQFIFRQPCVIVKSLEGANLGIEITYLDAAISRQSSILESSRVGRVYGKDDFTKAVGRLLQIRLWCPIWKGVCAWRKLPCITVMPYLLPHQPHQISRYQGYLHNINAVCT